MTSNRVTVTVAHTVHVKRTPEEVFDYTQDYTTRMDWDPTVKSAKVLSEDPRRVQVDLKGIGSLVIAYKLFRRGERTSAAFNDVRSRLIAGGGGSWSYAAADGGTDWTETSTLEFRNGLVGRLFAPILRRNMKTLSRKSMEKAKAIMESASPAPIGG
ncbi:MAG TPA: SRPBCC family protein [Candidatus Limnocylindria bacterium]|nr:SRPBCC family protein [Candidatus Limnocylindria bacterium]